MLHVSTTPLPGHRLLAMHSLQVTEHGVVPADGRDAVPLVNHFVIGAPLRSMTDSSASRHLPAASALSAAGHSQGDLRVASARAGLAVIHTQMAGDCGIDAMAYYAAVPRTASTYKAIRGALAMLMETVAEDPIWQDIFRARGEYQSPPPVPCNPRLVGF